jgi:transposase InsO family protein
MSFEQLIDLQQQHDANVSQLCTLFDVSRAGFYAARHARENPKARPLEAPVRKAFTQAQGSYGKRRIRQALAEAGITAGVYAVASEMKRQDLSAVWNQRKYVVTTDGDHAEPVFDNVLDRDFSPTAPNQAWVCDITYIWTHAGWAYLAVVLDLYGRKVVGWSIDRRMGAELVCQALKMAVSIRSPRAGLIVHSDRGSQYASLAHRQMLSDRGLVGSMSGKGDCWDNAVMERFFLSLKIERVWRRNYANVHEATKDVGDYIINFYNERRLHSALNYMTPNKFEALFAN